LRLKEL